MSSFEKAGVLFITGLVAVILALALFGTGASNKSIDASSGDTSSQATALKGSSGDVGESSPLPDPAVLRPEDDLWKEAAEKAASKRGGGVQLCRQ